MTETVTKQDEDLISTSAIEVVPEEQPQITLLPVVAILPDPATAPARAAIKARANSPENLAFKRKRFELGFEQLKTETQLQFIPGLKKSDADQFVEMHKQDAEQTEQINTEMIQMLDMYVQRHLSPPLDLEAQVKEQQAADDNTIKDQSELDKQVDVEIVQEVTK